MKIAFLGAGRMSSAMVKGLLTRNVFPATAIACTSGPDGTAEALSSATGIGVNHDLPSLLRDASVIVAAFKPQQLAEIDPVVAQESDGKLLLSILAGSRIEVLAKTFAGARNIVRAMPNLPGQIGAGISAYSFRSPPAPDDRTLVEAILGSLGEHLELPETQLDAVTALSGSGPAYVFEFIAALREAGVAAGLAREVACRLALATVAGSARFVQESGIDPETLREQVSSPGGTTLAGLKIMSDGGFRPLIEKTVQAARHRSEELSGPKS
jgi:pyrroline-5-carboxylate reductase